MAISRYAYAPRIAAGFQLGTSDAIASVRSAVHAGAIQCKRATLTANQRLDTVAGDEYGDGRYWWVIAAASDVGWALQCPAGTAIVIPELREALAYARAGDQP